MDSAARARRAAGGPECCPHEASVDPGERLAIAVTAASVFSALPIEPGFRDECGRRRRAYTTTFTRLPGTKINLRMVLPSISFWNDASVLK